MKECPHCKTQFTPHPKVGKRQKICGEPACKSALKADNNRKWRERNPDYYCDDYLRAKDWFEENPGYLKDYRESHPEYVEIVTQKVFVPSESPHLLSSLKLNEVIENVAVDLCSSICSSSISSDQNTYYCRLF